MMRTRFARRAWALPTAWLISACAGPSAAPLAYSVRRVTSAASDALLAQAESALVDRGYRIRSRDEALGVLVTEPVDVAVDRAFPGSSRILSRARLRRIVEVRVTSGDGGVSVFCKVAIQERVTEAHRLFALGGDGAPGRTPIEREAATTDEQNEVWRTIRRDRPTERDILSAILQDDVSPAG